MDINNVIGLLKDTDVIPVKTGIQTRKVDSASSLPVR
jgi:hypothetical protein